MRDVRQIGSQTAKQGFQNENDIVERFNHWQNDALVLDWLKIMGYEISEIEQVTAVKLYGFKTDVQVQVSIKLKTAIDVQNLQVKLVSNQKGFNQIDKRWVDKYIEMWQIPKEIAIILKKYTGELIPDIAHPRDKRRMFADEFSDKEQGQILDWLNANKAMIVSDILKGRGQFSAEWMLVAQKIKENARWTLKPMNFCLNFFGNEDIEITSRGNFRIGKITMQRKGGDAGRETAKCYNSKSILRNYLIKKENKWQICRV